MYRIPGCPRHAPVTAMQVGWPRAVLRRPALRMRADNLQAPEPGVCTVNRQRVSAGRRAIDDRPLTSHLPYHDWGFCRARQRARDWTDIRPSADPDRVACPYRTLCRKGGRQIERTLATPVVASPSAGRDPELAMHRSRGCGCLSIRLEQAAGREHAACEQRHLHPAPSLRLTSSPICCCTHGRELFSVGFAPHPPHLPHPAHLTHLTHLMEAVAGPSSLYSKCLRRIRWQGQMGRTVEQLQESR